MIRVGAFIWWCIAHDYGDIIFWSLLITFIAYLIWLMEETG